MARINVPITELFASQSYIGYDMYDATLRTQYALQTHADIRTFVASEGWTMGVVGPQSDRNNWPGLSLTLASGTTTTCSSVLISKPLDLLTNFADTDVISIALPAFPLTSINTALSNVKLTSDPAGSFASNTVSVALNASTTPLVTGNCEFVVPRSLFNGGACNLARVTGVSFSITTTSGCTFRAMAIRLLNQGWQRAPVDFDNLNGRLRQTIARNGDNTTAAPLAQPQLWRAAVPGGSNDPRPIDVELAVTFNTGSMIANNSFNIFLRESTGQFLNQLNLDGDSQTYLDGLGHQPDLGLSLYGQRPVGDLNKYTMDQLAGMTVQDLQRTSNPTNASWILFQVRWGTVSDVTVTNSVATGYPFALPALIANTNYMAICYLVEHDARLRIYQLNANGSVGALVFDTTTLVDDDTFKRRPGRVGWSAALGDGDAYLSSIRTRALCFGEYQSAPLNSFTPVVGAELYAAFTPDAQLFTTLGAYPSNSPSTVIVTRDSFRSTSGLSFKTQIYGSASQGVQSNLVEITDLNETQIEFDLYYPSGIINPGLTAALLSPDGYTIPLKLPNAQYDTWQHVTIYPPASDKVRTGFYSLLITQTSSSPAIWWVDKVSIIQRAMKWSARSSPQDPWVGGIGGWTDFRANLNKSNAGVLFAQRGKQFQVRARALRQDAAIYGAPKFVPKYAELGRFVWPETAINVAPPIANFTLPSTRADHTYTFADNSTPGTGIIVLRQWDFGDGNSAIGQNVMYTYPTPGTYTVTLTAIDQNGQRNSLSRGSFNA